MIVALRCCTCASEPAGGAPPSGLPQRHERFGTPTLTIACRVGLSNQTAVRVERRIAGFECDPEHVQRGLGVAAVAV